MVSERQLRTELSSGEIMNNFKVLTLIMYCSETNKIHTVMQSRQFLPSVTETGVFDALVNKQTEMEISWMKKIFHVEKVRDLEIWNF